MFCSAQSRHERFFSQPLYICAQRARERIEATKKMQRQAEEVPDKCTRLRMLLACYTLYLSAVVSQAKEAQKEEELSGTLRKLEEDQFVKVKEKHKIDGKLEENAALREV